MAKKAASTIQPEIHSTAVEAHSGESLGSRDDGETWPREGEGADNPVTGQVMDKLLHHPRPATTNHEKQRPHDACNSSPPNPPKFNDGPHTWQPTSDATIRPLGKGSLRQSVLVHC